MRPEETAADLLFIQGRFAEAEQAYRALVARYPDALPGVMGLGCALRKQQRLDEALPWLRKATEIAPDMGLAHHNLGGVLLAMGRVEEARAAYERGVATGNFPVDLLIQLGSLHADQGRLEEALHVFALATRLQPDHASGWQWAGIMLYRMERHAEAEPFLSRALELDPDNGRGWSALGTVLRFLDRTEESCRAHRRAVALSPNDPNIWHNAGIAFARLHLEEAVAAFRRAIALDPTHAGARDSLGRALLLKGEYGEGLANFEWRSNAVDFRANAELAGVPLWDGGQLPEGGLALWGEGGIGDLVHYVRFVPQAAERLGQISFMCHPDLDRLFRLSGLEASAVINPGEGVPVTARAQLMSLPHLLGITAETIPARVPYLRPDPAEAAHWRHMLRGHPGPRVGVCWAGSDGGSYLVRSVPAETFLPLMAVEGCTFVNLQKGKPGPGWADAIARTVDPTPFLHDFADMCAVIDALDLVITVDTSIAHGAGALAKPVWTLLSAMPDYRWMLGRDDTPWYPTMRLIRQQRDGDWAGVVERAADELRRFVTHWTDSAR